MVRPFCDEALSLFRSDAWYFVRYRERRPGERWASTACLRCAALIDSHTSPPHCRFACVAAARSEQLFSHVWRFRDEGEADVITPSSQRPEWSRIVARSYMYRLCPRLRLRLGRAHFFHRCELEDGRAAAKNRVRRKDLLQRSLTTQHSK